ncbi:LOB domain-containing protein 38-like [Senna tora]|uniref:LOB domain-containing protein 38-like n=1 Tax=Senna tora TaxID=362788 RepID=A0A834WHR0_9FABA|nr:LOB domain-containing protein 38-like [Senna tora]
MSCNGCRVLRKRCSDECVLRSCLQWIHSPAAQAHATLFLAKFFGRTDLISFISSVPLTTRPALFQSLLYEACGRTVNPVNGSVGLLWTGNWHVCQAAVETILAGGVLQPMLDQSSSDTIHSIGTSVGSQSRPSMDDLRVREMNQKPAFHLSLLPESYAALRRQSNQAMSLVSAEYRDEKNKLLNLFV